jgi:threonine synthase
LPQLLGVQAVGAAPLVIGQPVEHPETRATAIQIGKPARGEQALAAAAESGGRIIAASDEDILAMQRRLAQEGIWVEPASAAGLAGLKNELAGGNLDVQGKIVVVICTGHGLKDPEIVTAEMPKLTSVNAELSVIESLIL